MTEIGMKWAVLNGNLSTVPIKRTKSDLKFEKAKRDWTRIKNSIKNRCLGCRKVVAPVKEMCRCDQWFTNSYKITNLVESQRRRSASLQDPPRSRSIFLDPPSPFQFVTVLVVLLCPQLRRFYFFFLLSSFCCLVALVLLQRFSFDSIGGKKQLRPPFYYIYNQFEIWSKFLKSLYGFMSFHGLLLKRSE